MIPTASSAQMRRRSTSSITHIAILYLMFFTFLITNSHIRPVPNSRTPPATKSNSVHFTSSVNSIANNGTSNIIAMVSRMMISLLFCKIINVLIRLPLPTTPLYANYHNNQYSILIMYFILTSHGTKINSLALLLKLSEKLSVAIQLRLSGKA